MWSLYDRHFVGITWHNVWSIRWKIYPIIQTKLSQLVKESVHMIINLPTKPLKRNHMQTCFQCFAYKLAAKNQLA